MQKWIKKGMALLMAVTLTVSAGIGAVPMEALAEETASGVSMPVEQENQDLPEESVLEQEEKDTIDFPAETEKPSGQETGGEGASSSAAVPEPTVAPSEPEEPKSEPVTPDEGEENPAEGANSSQLEQPADLPAEEEPEVLSTEQLKEEIYDLLEQSAAIGEQSEEELAQLEERMEQISAFPIPMDDQGDEELESLIQQLQNAKASVEDMRTAYQAQREGWLDQLPQTGKENSWRYQNGQKIESAEAAALSLPDGVTTFSAGRYWGIDVSHHQGEIDWEAVKKAGIDFAVIRCGYGNDQTDQDDRQWERNVSECERLGIPYGVYFYSYAVTADMAVSEGQHAVRLLKGHNPDLPVFYDLEENRQLVVGNSGLAEIARIFADIVSAQGYEVGVYASLNWWNNYLTDPVFENWYRWVAEWRPSCSYGGRYEMWQYASDGSIDGIRGNVDMNYWYGDLPYLANGLVKDEKTGNWYYYVNGKIDTSYTGLVQYSASTYYYVKNGVLDWGYTGMASQGSRLGYVAKGRLDTAKNGLYKVDGTWYNFAAGWVKNDYTGLVKYSSGSYYYVENGVLDWNYTGLAQYNQGGYYYVKNGKLDWNYTGMASQGSRLGYVAKGRLDTAKNGLYKEDGTWYNFAAGWVKSDYTGLVKYSSGSYYYVENGVLDWNYTGLAQYNQGGYYYVKNGKLDWNYTGMASQGSRLGYVAKGRLDTAKNGLYKEDGTWYNFAAGWVKSDYTGLVKYSSGSYYYVENGVLDWNYTGLAQYNQGGYYYVKNGKLDWNYTGMASQGSRLGYVAKGRLDTTKNGRYQVDGVWYDFVSGWVKET